MVEQFVYTDQAVGSSPIPSKSFDSSVGRAIGC